jgi:RNA 2',3'-cyclic 3'-phosphodiesterase
MRLEYAAAMSKRMNASTLQPNLFGAAPRARAEVHRLFFALMPDDDMRRHIHALAGWLQDRHPDFRARWVKPERFHATLNFLGDYPTLRDDLVEAAVIAAGGLHASPFEWTLDYVASFRGREPPCVLRCSHMPALLLELWQALGKALVLADLHRRAERQYTPHITLAYARQVLPEPIPIEPIAWHVDRFVLVHNVVGKGNYQILGEWPLSAGSAG